jgi:hypothetical protein
MVSHIKPINILWMEIRLFLVFGHYEQDITILEYFRDVSEE